VRADVLTDFSLSDLLDRIATERLDTVMKQIVDGYPVAYATGKKYWYKWSWYCAPGVLIPRSETEELLAWILDRETTGAPMRALDVGCGTGVIGIGLALESEHIRVDAADVAEAARQLTAKNATSLGADVKVILLDLLDHSTWTEVREYDLIVSNPPYIPPVERSVMDASVLAHEPDLALFTEDSHGLQFYEALTELAAHKLVTGGRLYLELNEYHAPKVADHLRSFTGATGGFTEIEIRQDIYGKDRMLRAIWNR